MQSAVPRAGVTGMIESVLPDMADITVSAVGACCSLVLVVLLTSPEYHPRI